MIEMILPDINTLFVFLVFLFFFNFFIVKSKWLDFLGILIGNILVVAVLFLSGSMWVLVGFGLALFLSFFISRKKHRKRGAANILSKGLLATMAIPFGLVFSFAALAEAVSDTFASEIGIKFKKPRLIIGWKVVKAGTDGAVSLLGFYAAFIGALLISLYFVIFIDASLIKGGIVLLAGYFGQVFDSVLGVYQNRVKILNNDTVNFFGNLFAVLVAFLLKVVLNV